MNHPIPVGTGSWEESHPGFGEIGLVAHCGETPADHYANTLNYTDTETAWSEREGVFGRAQLKVYKALTNIAG